MPICFLVYTKRNPTLLIVKKKIFWSAILVAYRSWKYVDQLDINCSLRKRTAKNPLTSCLG